MDHYPWDVLRCAQLRWRPVDSFIMGPETIFGETQRRNPKPGFRWQAELTGINLNTPQRASLWEAMLLNWRMGNELTVVPRFGGPLTPLADGQSPRILTPFSDGSPFSDGGQFSQPAIEAYLTEDVALGATLAKIMVTGAGRGRRWRGAEPFGLFGQKYRERLHGVARFESMPEDDAADGLYVVRFGPSAREAYPAGTPVNVTDPSCVMRPQMQEGDKMWPTFQRPFKAMVGVTFVETLVMTDGADGD